MKAVRVALAAFLAASLYSLPSPAQTPRPVSATKVSLGYTEQRSLTSKKIGQKYDLLVSLPADYATSGKSYPVLYNSVRLASFPAGLYWVYRPDKGK